jgi:LacI family transcriptional regulator
MRQSRRPTLSDVAKRAGVGTTTVSRVINGGKLVDPVTLARVRRAIEALEYTPNQAARTLKGARTRAIGLLVPSIADPFFASCAESAQDVARRNDSLLTVLTTQNEPRLELESINVLIQHRTDGLIIAPGPSSDSALRQLLERAGVPAVAMDRPVPHSSIPYVVADNRAGATVACRHLIDHGYQRIACWTGEPALYTIRERIRGYRQSMKAAGLPLLIDDSIMDYSSAESAVRRLLADPAPPDAILTLKNSTTIYVFEALQNLGVAVPERVALLGYDDFELAAALQPSITTIQQPTAEIGRQAAELLFEYLEEYLEDIEERMAIRKPIRNIHLHTALIQRHSCGCR